LLSDVAKLARVKNSICRSHTSSSNQSTYEGPGRKTLGGDTSKGGKDEGRRDPEAMVRDVVVVAVEMRDNDFFSPENDVIFDHIKLSPLDDDI
jgi:hypothetical protein